MSDSSLFLFYLYYMYIQGLNSVAEHIILKCWLDLLINSLLNGLQYPEGERYCKFHQRIQRRKTKTNTATANGISMRDTCLTRGPEVSGWRPQCTEGWWHRTPALHYQANLQIFKKLKMKFFMWNLPLWNVGDNWSLHGPLRLGLPIFKAWITKLLLNTCLWEILITLEGKFAEADLRLRVGKWLA